MDIDPYASARKPTPTKISPKANFAGPEGFQTFSQSFENEEARVMMKKEFNIWNQDTVTSVCSKLNSLATFQKPSIHMSKNEIAVAITVSGYLAKMRLDKRKSTQETIRIGKIVNAASTHLNMVPALPESTLCV